MRSTPLPEHIGRFQVEALLGRGGMGEVYKAFDPTLQRTVAVKTVRPDIDRPEYLDRLMREAQACARLSHPHIVTVFEAGQIDGIVYIAMEYLQGENLSQVLERKDLSFEGKIRILASAARVNSAAPIRSSHRPVTDRPRPARSDRLLLCQRRRRPRSTRPGRRARARQPGGAKHGWPECQRYHEAKLGGG